MNKLFTKIAVACVGLAMAIGVGVAVGNAYSELKQVAKFTTKAPVEKGAFAEAVYKFIDF